MYLESLTDQEFQDLGQGRQVEILAEHCAGIEEKIRSARSREDAETIAETTCGKLQEACLSNLVQRALVRRTREIIDQYWTSKAG
jgi:hypothetical protein